MGCVRIAMQRAAVSKPGSALKSSLGEETRELSEDRISVKRRKRGYVQLLMMRGEMEGS
jgi:hypothetical protein